MLLRDVRIGYPGDTPVSEVRWKAVVRAILGLAKPDPGLEIDDAAVLAVWVFEVLDQAVGNEGSDGLRSIAHRLPEALTEAAAAVGRGTPVVGATLTSSRWLSFPGYGTLDLETGEPVEFGERWFECRIFNMAVLHAAGLSRIKTWTEKPPPCGSTPTPSPRRSSSSA